MRARSWAQSLLVGQRRSGLVGVQVKDAGSFGSFANGSSGICES